MPITAKNSGGFERELPEAGIHHAVCTKVFDIGMQMNTYNGQTSYQHKVLIIWELDETMKEGEYAGKRFVVHKEYTLSLHEKATLRKDMQSWRGKSFSEKELEVGFDLEKLLKVQCTLNIVIATAKSTGNEYVKVDGVMPAQKDAPMLIPELPDDWCPDWIEQKVNEGAGAAGAIGEEKADPDEEVPF